MWGAIPSSFLRAFPGPRGRRDLKSAPKDIRPVCLQAPRPGTRMYPGLLLDRIPYVRQCCFRAGFWPGCYREGTGTSHLSEGEHEGREEWVMIVADSFVGVAIVGGRALRRL